MRLSLAGAASLLLVVALAAAGDPATRPAVRWQHPAGLVDAETVREVQAKLDTQAWARALYESRKQVLAPWRALPSEQLRAVFPRKRGNVYHNFSCPADRTRLTFKPLDPTRFTCPSCGAVYEPSTDAGIYGPGDRYHGTMYDGWVCLFHLDAPLIAADMGLVSKLEKAGVARVSSSLPVGTGEDSRAPGDTAEAYARRGVELLMLYAEVLPTLATKPDPDPQMRVILTYHREGDGKLLYELARAYEMLRDEMSDEQRTRFERDVLRRMLDDIMLEPIYRYEHNNLYQWHRTIVQVGLALHREDLIDWSMGRGAFSRERQPEHRSIARLAATHFKPDGAYWEMCSGYHLYPLDAFCELAVISNHLSRMDEARFSRAAYDLTCPANVDGATIRRALHWFMDMAMPDRTMPTVGDSMAPRAGMQDYYNVAETGYRYFDLTEVGDYQALREGRRSWAGLLYGAPSIERRTALNPSANLSSGWVSLRGGERDNPTWIGLNALIPGGGHQHADRLSLLSYAEGTLLGLEKATPYNEAVTRELGTISPSHNTVTVDMTSQPQGESLRPEQIPQVAVFFANDLVRFAEVRADRIYPQCGTYRRAVLSVEDVYVDCFDVCGGKVHDWMWHHAGPAPTLSVPTTPASFEPAGWLANGRPEARLARTDGPWDARWQVGGVTSRITMLGSPGTEVYSLQTYPVTNAMITAQHPACETLCVRRRTDEPFIAVGDAWRGQPRVTEVAAGREGHSLSLATAAHCYWVALGPGRASFADGVQIETDGSAAMLRDRGVAFLAAGRRLRVITPEGDLEVRLDRPGNAFVDFTTSVVQATPLVAYTTVSGTQVPSPEPAVTTTASGSLWRRSPSEPR